MALSRPFGSSGMLDKNFKNILDYILLDAKGSMEKYSSVFLLGVIHILRNHQEVGGFRNDYSNLIFALSNAEFD